MVPCVYCLETGELREDQVLLRGKHFYLCAPRGQLVEGFLAIAPYRHAGTLATLPGAHFGELQRLKDVASDFYGEAAAIFYEQGRAGGDVAEEFPLHAHLCSLPLAPDIHGALAERYDWRDIAGVHALPGAVDGPYIYVETAESARVYVARDAEGRDELARMRLKPMIAERIGMPERGHWRDHPGDAELARLIERFAAFRARR